MGSISFLLLFPDGRCVPRWTRWLALAFAVRLANWYAHHAADPNGGPRPLFLAALLPRYAGGVLAQLYRRAAGPVQRQRSTWVIFSGAAITVGWYLFDLLRLGVPPLARAGTAQVLYQLIGLPLAVRCELVLPVSLAVAVLPYRPTISTCCSAARWSTGHRPPDRPRSIGCGWWRCNAWSAG
jgi:hypothetical protein